jgi:hypothetical protein
MTRVTNKDVMGIGIRGWSDQGEHHLQPNFQ